MYINVAKEESQNGCRMMSQRTCRLGGEDASSAMLEDVALWQIWSDTNCVSVFSGIPSLPSPTNEIVWLPGIQQNIKSKMSQHIVQIRTWQKQCINCIISNKNRREHKYNGHTPDRPQSKTYALISFLLYLVACYPWSGLNASKHPSHVESHELGICSRIQKFPFQIRNWRQLARAPKRNSSH